ncbi:hypothetical protein ALC62_15344 [Cyphomyrmex costatus]|uniref:Integrase catalytic domain-containing protein n=1 Tax=Cyphomyrmex costatus TaxID=456900 RepID=A0A151I7H3_9HYME|nr:hypothetical protein ALC62_15344 [Cyphomyrmex costatus]
MSMDLQTLLTAQSDIHGCMARSVLNLKKLGEGNITLHATETRIVLLDKLWSKFEAQHELIRGYLKETFDESEYNSSGFADSAENTYVQQRSLLNEYVQQLKTSRPNSPSVPEFGTELFNKTFLPRLKIRSFSGAFEDWPTFRDIFKSIVGDNASISAVEKFHHLKACLEGPAETLIRPLSVTGDNYPRAWALLSKHYENKRELARSNFSTFAAMAKMKCNTAEELNRIYHVVTSVVNGQESIGRTINSHGFDPFNHLVIELFDTKMRLEWETHSSTSNELPSHETLLDFISKRALTLNAAKPKSSKVSGDSTRPAKAHYAKRNADSPQCSCARASLHYNVMMCENFKIAIFVCFCSKAVHIEVVLDYTAEAFLAALRRFSSRRGLCSDIYSDCGTNFLGADRQLRQLLRASSLDGRCIAHSAADGIRWHFNPPSAPHFGGLWETAVKSTKYHLRRVIGDSRLTFEEISTLLAQVEACLNSRPMYALSDDPEDINALTPGHLLIGAPLLAIPEPSLTERKDSSLTRWQLIQKMRDHFWQRWSREYLHTLASKPTWTVCVSIVFCTFLLATFNIKDPALCCVQRLSVFPC